MNYSQFISLVKQHPPGGIRDAALLGTFLEKYPYCQSARILYSKFLMDTGDPQASDAMRLAALYSGDRSKLQQLINEAAASVVMAHPGESIFADAPGIFIEEPSVFTSVDRAPFAEEEPTKENIFVTPSPEPFLSGQEITGSVAPKTEPLKEFIVTPQRMESETARESDPHEIIRRRLNEILAGKQPDTEVQPNPKEEFVTKTEVKPETEIVPEPIVTSEVERVEEPVAQEEVPVEKEIVREDRMTEGAEEVILRREIMQVNDEVEEEELAHIAGESALHTLEKFTEPLSVQPAPMNFTDWLRNKPVASFGYVEEVNGRSLPPITVFAPGLKQEESSPEANDPENVMESTASPKALIERFIATEPRISPSKTEFYSPAIQAKRSVEEDENLVTETLAKIYLEQGMLAKARAAYQKLSLLIPEKSSSFAALVEEIDKTLNTEE